VTIRRNVEESGGGLCHGIYLKGRRDCRFPSQVSKRGTSQRSANHTTVTFFSFYRCFYFLSSLFFFSFPLLILLFLILIPLCSFFFSFLFSLPFYSSIFQLHIIAASRGPSISSSSSSESISIWDHCQVVYSCLHLPYIRNLTTFVNLLWLSHLDCIFEVLTAVVMKSSVFLVLISISHWAAPRAIVRLEGFDQ
jgi:hypothetical protein